MWLHVQPNLLTAESKKALALRLIVKPELNNNDVRL